MHDDTDELTLFLSHGVVAWLRLHPTGQTEHDRWANPHRRYNAGNLAILLANMMES